MDNPIPRGPKGLYCPLSLSNPLGPSLCEKTCHTCPLWQHIRGVNKNTGEQVDKWMCSLAQLPMLLLENAQQGRFVEGAVNELRKEQDVKHEEMKRYAGAQVHAARAVHTALTTQAPPQVLLEDKS